MEAVIFDCDGVLVDSESLCWDAWRAVLGRYDMRVEPADTALLIGLPDAEIAAFFAARGGLPAVSRVLAELDEHERILYATSVRPFADAQVLARALAAEGVPIAVATNGTRAHLAAMLGFAELDDVLEVRVAVDDVARGKPAPDVYLEAARRLEIDPGRCIAIEDSPTGLSAALAAGMTTIGIARDPGHAASLGHAHAVVHSLERRLLPTFGR